MTDEEEKVEESRWEGVSLWDQEDTLWSGEAMRPAPLERMVGGGRLGKGAGSGEDCMTEGSLPAAFPLGYLKCLYIHEKMAISPASLG